jgi:glycosyltransferase involved in cell wall biosynthesis
MRVVDLPMLPGIGHSLVNRLNRGMISARLRRVMAGLGRQGPIVLTTLPYIIWLIDGLERHSLIYYCTDDYSHWPSADRLTLRKADSEISRRADLILAASRTLEQKYQATGRCHYFPHGVDFGHFSSAQGRTDIPEVVARLPRPRIGFFGLLYEKIDYELLGELAREFPDASLVLIGPQAYYPPTLTEAHNIHLLGPMPYAELPRAIAGLDALLMPYVSDEMIRQSGPLKLRECLATGKPTVSIDIPDVRPFQPHVRIGKNRREFIEQVRAALEEGSDPLLAAARRRAVERDGWDSRAAWLRETIRQLARSGRTDA